MGGTLQRTLLLRDKVTDVALEAMETLPTTTDLNELPSMDELVSAIESMPITL